MKMRKIMQVDCCIVSQNDYCNKEYGSVDEI